MRLIGRPSGDKRSAKMNAGRVSDDVERIRATHLGRGNLLLQNGAFETQDEWEDIRADHGARVTRIEKWLTEDKPTAQ